MLLVACAACPGGVHAGILKIVVAGPASGAQAAETSAMLSGAQAAAAHLSALGPDTYQVVRKDDGCDAGVALETAKAIVADGADLVLGHPCPKAALAAAKVYAAAGLTYIATATRHPDLTARRAGPSIFRLSGRDDAQGKDAAHYLAAARLASTPAAAKPVAIVHDRTLYAKAIAEQAAAELKAEKFETITATIVAGDKEYAKLIAKIKDADAVFFAGFPLEAGFIVTALRAAGSGALVLASDTIATPEFTASFPQIAKECFVLMATAQDVEANARTALRLFGRAREMPFGPFANAAAQRAAVNAALHAAGAGDLAHGGRHAPHSELAGGTTFDAAGNANIESYGLVRWSGDAWNRVLSMR